MVCVNKRVCKCRNKFGYLEPVNELINALQYFIKGRLAFIIQCFCQFILLSESLPYLFIAQQKCFILIDWNSKIIPRGTDSLCVVCIHSFQ